MKTLALDLATRTGWALHDDGVTTSGVLNLDGASMQGPAEDPCPYWLKLRNWLPSMMLSFGDRMVIERGFFRGAGSTYLTGLQVVARMYAAEHGIHDTCVPPLVVKRHFTDVTGVKTRSKETMLDAARDRWPGVFDDNESDALWILDWKLKQQEAGNG